MQQSTTSRRRLSLSSAAIAIGVTSSMRVKCLGREGVKARGRANSAPPLGQSAATTDIRTIRRAPAQDLRYDYCACLRSLNLAEKEATVFREWGELLAEEGEYLTD